TGPQATPNAVATNAPDGDDGDWGIRDSNAISSPEYARVVEKVENMVGDPDVQNGVRRRGLSVMNVMWEDTGRAEGSALGPNITDLTLEVRRRYAQGNFMNALMPVIRFPNFTDRTGDIASDRFFVRVGNERAGEPLQTIALTELLKDIKKYVSVPESI